MAAGQWQQVLRRIRHLVGERGADETSDGRLLERFVSQGDEGAFETLLRRHGPMVLGVCRRTLHDAHLAEDAFQATFLVLVRKAGSLRQGERVANWLYGVACRVARKARARGAGRREIQREMTDMASTDTTDGVDWRDLRAVLDQEIEWLPAKYREPFVLTYLQGKATAVVARELGCPEGTVHGRLARARERLRSRLARRGVTLSGAALAALLAGNALTAAVPPALAGVTLQAASLVASGVAVAAAKVSASVTALVKGALREMVAEKLRSVVVVLLGLGLLGLGLGFAAHLASAKAPPPAEGPAAAPKPEGPKPVADRADELPAGALARIGSPRFNFGDGVISYLAYSQDGGRLAALGHGNLERVAVWDARTGKRLYLVESESLYKKKHGKDGYPDQFYGFALSPDGKTLACAIYGMTHEKIVYLWDLTAGKQLHALQDYAGPLAFAPDGKRLAAAGNDGTVRLLATATGKEEMTLAGSVAPAAFSADGKWLAAWGKDMMVHLWDPATGKETGKLDVGAAGNPLAGMVSDSFTFAPSAPLLALRWTVRDRIQGKGAGIRYSAVTTQVWDVSTGKKLHEFPEGGGTVMGKAASSLAFSPDGKTLYSQGWGGGVRALDLATGKERFTIEGIRNPVVLSPDGKTLTSWEGRSLRFWEAATGKEQALGPAGHRGSALHLTVAPDGKTLASAGVDGTLGLWDLGSGKEIVLKGPEDVNAFVPVGFALDGKALVVSCPWGFRTLDAATGKELRPIENRLRNVGSAYGQVSPDGKRLAWAEGRKIHVADVATGKEVASFEDGPDPRGLAFSTDSKLLAQVRQNGRENGTYGPIYDIHVWDLATGERRCKLPPKHMSPYVVRLWLLPDGKTLAIDTSAGIGFWDIAGEKERLNIAGRYSAALSPDGKLILTETKDALYVQETASGKELYKLERPPWRGWRMILATFSPDGKVLAIAKEDGGIQLLDAATGKERRTLRGHEARVKALAFTPDGRKLVSGGEDTTILIWDAKDFQK